MIVRKWVDTDSTAGLGPVPRILVKTPAPDSLLAFCYWAENYDQTNREKLMLASSTTGGATWDITQIANLENEQVGDHHFDPYVPITYNPMTGKLHAVYCCTNRVSTGPHKIYHFTNESGSWTRTLLSTITKAVNPPHMSSMVGTADGTIHMIFNGFRNNGDIASKTWYSRWFEGSWSLWEKEIGTEAGATMYEPVCDMSATGTDSIVVSAARTITATGDVLPSFQTRSGAGVWSSWNNYNGDPLVEAHEITVFVDPTNQDMYFIGVSYWDADGAGLTGERYTWVFKYQNGVGWDSSFTAMLHEDTETGIPGQTTFTGCNTGSLIKDSLGDIHAVYTFTPTQPDLPRQYTRTYSNGVWGTEQLLATGTALESFFGASLFADYYHQMKKGYAGIYGRQVFDAGLTLLEEGAYFYKSDHAIWSEDSFPPMNANLTGELFSRFAFTLKTNGVEVSPVLSPNFPDEATSVPIFYRKFELANESGRDAGALWVYGEATLGALTFAEGTELDTIEEAVAYSFSENVYLTPTDNLESKYLWVKWYAGLKLLPAMTNRYNITVVEL